MKNNLKQIRKVKCVTQKQLADSLGVSKAMISMWENNSNEKIPQMRVRQICEYLNIEENELYTSELNIKALESHAIQEEIERLEQRYRTATESRNDLVVDKLMTSHKEIENEIINIGDDTYKLEQVTRFLKFMNNADIATKFDGIQPYGFNALIDGLLKLLEEQKITKLDILLKVVTYLALENKVDFFNEDDEFNLVFGKFLSGNNFKLTGDD